MQGPDCRNSSSHAMGRPDPMPRPRQSHPGTPGTDEANLCRRRAPGRPRGILLKLALKEGAPEARSPTSPIGPAKWLRRRPSRSTPKSTLVARYPADRDPRPPGLRRVPPERPGDRADRRAPPGSSCSTPSGSRRSTSTRSHPGDFGRAPRGPHRRLGRRDPPPLARIFRPEAGRRHRPQGDHR